ncbi:MAG: dTDP-4-dehydrorhamnose reductase [Roseateles depolymerans]|uniref:dTDP-4-dehydrorhamnose reductase n=1 Tax=Roseateles depolymerans TaxID=76731 RepID=A0A2W5DQZ2_9BURK|nr:MAG: dTDP-4-dehydrorhamnose reductase [Roseateles depolymerans]
MKILLLGPHGQLGWELQRSLAVAGEVVALNRDNGGDLAYPQGLLAAVQAIAPQVIVNAAAYTAVDKAESDAELARHVNTDAPALLAIEAKRLGSLLVHYSTDYVFDGSGHTPRDEDAPIAPLSVYGQTKADGEDAIRASGCQHLILRTSWVYAARGGNFARTMLRLAAEREQLQVIADQIGAPTGADLLADLSTHMLRAARANPALSGTYHAVAGGETSWHEYARFVIEFARSRGAELKVAPGQILPIATAQYPTPARRPLNSRLSTARLQQRFGLTLPHWQQGVTRLLHEIL